MATTSTFDENYQSVADRIKIFREKYPEGSLTALDPSKPFEIVTVGEQSFVAVAAVAKRNPDDTAGGMGLAWCPLPGYDEYTRNSEIQNAQSSAWGRAIIAVLAADSTKIASAEEVKSATSHRAAPAKEAAPAKPPASAATANGTSVKPMAAPLVTDTAQEDYNTAVITESVRLLSDPTTTYDGLRDVWTVLNQAGLSARRITPPANMDPDGDGLVPIGSAVAFVGKERKDAEDAATAPQQALPAAPAAEETPAPAARRTRKVAAASE